MKEFVLYISFLLLAPAMAAQNKTELAKALTRDLETFRRVTLRSDFDSTLQFMPPKMFDLIPRDSLRAVMTRALNNEYLSIEMTGYEYKGKRKIKKAGIYHWAIITYDGRMKFHLKGEDAFNELMIPMLKSAFGDDNVVKHDAKTLGISLPGKKIIAYKDPSSSIWYFLEDKRGSKDEDAAVQQHIYETIVPEAVKMALKEQKASRK